MTYLIVVAGKFGHIQTMPVHTNLMPSHTKIRAAGHILRVWMLALVILMTGMTQSGVVSAMFARANAAPGGDVILICTADGVRAVSFGNAKSDGAPQNAADHSAGHSGDHAAGHGFCSLCASHHGGMANLDLPFGAPVSIIHDAEYANARGVAATITVPRTRYSRAPPLSV